MMTILNRLREASTGSRELDAEIMFDLFAKPVGERKDGGPVGYLWPEDNPSWNFGLRFPDSTKEQILSNRKHVDGETLIIERDGANVLMNSIRIPLVTTSIDAAIALVERMLPGKGYWIVRDPVTMMYSAGLSWAESLAVKPETWPISECSEASEPTLAILTALFTALEKENVK